MSNEADTENKRKFSRVPFQSKIQINSDDGNWSCELIDISLKGVLTTAPKHWSAALGDRFQVKIILDSSEVSILMDASVAHIENDHIGLACEHIDIDSISHLRRLMELNVGDPDILERELSDLINHG